ncbi:MAG: tetratricopeptide repeat protein [Methylophilus sp.]
MKLGKALTLLSTTLFLNTVYAASDNASSCNKAYEQMDLVSAATFASKALSINQHDKDALICQGRVLSVQGKLDDALSSFKLADQESKDAFDKTIIALVTGHAYKDAAQYEQAVASYERSLEQAKIARSKAFERVAQQSIGNVYLKAMQYESALTSFLAANTLSANDNERGESYESVAQTYHLLGQHDSALEYQIKAFLMHEKAGTLDQYAHSSIELGRYYAAVKNFVSAERTLNKIIKFAKDQGGAYYEAYGYCILAQVKSATGDLVTAKKLIEQAKQIAKTSNDQALAEEIDKEAQGVI